MVGVAFTTTQSSGVTTTFATILDVRWQPMLSAACNVGFFVNEASFLNGMAPVSIVYAPLNVQAFDMTQALPPQIVSQLIAAGGVCAGGTPV